MSHSSAKLTINAGELADSITASIADESSTDERTSTLITCKDRVISIDFDHQKIPHLRANLNSILRLIQASHGALDATRPSRR